MSRWLGIDLGRSTVRVALLRTGYGRPVIEALREVSIVPVDPALVPVDPALAAGGEPLGDGQTPGFDPGLLAAASPPAPAVATDAAGPSPLGPDGYDLHAAGVMDAYAGPQAPVTTPEPQPLAPAQPQGGYADPYAQHQPAPGDYAGQYAQPQAAAGTYADPYAQPQADPASLSGTAMAVQPGAAAQLAPGALPVAAGALPGAAGQAAVPTKAVVEAIVLPPQPTVEAALRAAASPFCGGLAPRWTSSESRRLARVLATSARACGSAT